jgi:Glycosyl hydrolases family 18
MNLRTITGTIAPTCRLRFSALALLLFTALAAALPQHAFALPACFTVWSSSAIYTAGGTASLNGTNYTANWWTQGQSPATNNGGSGSGQPWTSNGSCGSTTNPPPPPPPPPPTGANLFAPYVDMSITADENLVSIQQTAGFTAVTLAFLDASNGCSVGWGGLGGTLPSDTLANGTSIHSVIESLQSAGVQVILSFGGANGTEPALNCTSASQLQALYQSAINLYGVKMLDFDIEGGATTNQASITRRDQALVGLKAANTGLVISYTLPVLPTGLIASGVNILNSARADGLALDLVNIMTMDYGSASDNGGQMGLDATNAAAATEAQIVAAGLTAKVGITPMIGVNDISTEVFSLSNAQTVVNFANANSYVGRLALWSLGRDNGSCAGAGFASPSCSSVTQTPYQFTQIFKAY